MRDKLYSVRFLTLMSLLMVFGVYSSKGQSTYWSEEFNTLPDWNLEENWKALPGQIVFSWEPVISSFDCSATSNSVFLDDHVQSLVVNQFLDVFDTSSTEFAQIILLTDSGDFPIWDYTLADGDWGDPAGTEISFSLEPYQGQNVRFRFRTWGQDSFNWTGWNIFSVSVFATYNQDLALTSIEGPTYLNLFQNGLWAVVVGNMGSVPMNDYEVGITDYLSGDLLQSEIETEALLPGEFKIYILEYAPDASRNTFVTGTIESAGDEFAGNNVTRELFLRIEPEQAYSILFWDFDNNVPDVLNPETGQLVTSAEGYKLVLGEMGVDFDEVNELPATLDGYDMILSTMGSYCLS